MYIMVQENKRFLKNENVKKTSKKNSQKKISKKTSKKLSKKSDISTDELNKLLDSDSNVSTMKKYNSNGNQIMENQMGNQMGNQIMGNQIMGNQMGNQMMGNQMMGNQIMSPSNYDPLLLQQMAPLQTYNAMHNSGMPTNLLTPNRMTQGLSNLGDLKQPTSFNSNIYSGLNESNNMGNMGNMGMEQTQLNNLSMLGGGRSKYNINNLAMLGGNKKRLSKLWLNKFYI